MTTNQDEPKTTPAPVAPCYNEAPASFNVKYYLAGFDCQLTIRANTADELLPRIDRVITWLTKNEATPIRNQANGYMPPSAPAQPQAPQAPRAAQPQAAQPQAAGPGETINVKTISHAATEGGHHYIRVKGGRFTKYGARAWEEVIPVPVEEWQNWAIGTEFVPPPDMAYAEVSDDGKKVLRFKAQP